MRHLRPYPAKVIHSLEAAYTLEMEQHDPMREREEHEDQTHFVLNEVQWSAFMDALELPARRKPRLENLLREPSILDAG